MEEKILLTPEDITKLNLSIEDILFLTLGFIIDTSNALYVINEALSKHDGKITVEQFRELYRPAEFTVNVVYPHLFGICLSNLAQNDIARMKIDKMMLDNPDKVFDMLSDKIKSIMGELVQQFEDMKGAEYNE